LRVKWNGTRSVIRVGSRIFTIRFAFGTGRIRAGIKFEDAIKAWMERAEARCPGTLQTASHVVDSPR